ncbi:MULTISPECIES: phosphate propanoyltransferase [unclassified Romboutsia]|uniref:phosphate propanoyltransferase n=1 Tax=unclassified Romboutsia TaxID=2626894 RepID=UPI000822D731|nr:MULTISPECIES: phosphate propanoyltransferase [unclassified Romboutsia]SCI25240.1 Phosphate propanoyltransferase [uncultured Clostridium sp.]
MDISQDILVKLITEKVIEKLNESKEVLIPIGISNRHIHLCREDLNHLFGKGYELTKIKDLKQPGQFASNEVVTIKGPKGEIKNVRILGPLRDETQVEISISDGFKLGVKPPIKESGKLDNTPGITIIGPKGSIELKKGTIAALRHIHMTPKIANQLNIKDKDEVRVEIKGIRSAVLGNVLVRVSDKYDLEMHLDVDEANACYVKNGDLVKIVE